MDLEDLKSKLFGAAEAVIMNMDCQETGAGLTGGEISPTLKSRYRGPGKKSRFRGSPWGTPSRNLLGSFCSLSSFGSSNEITDLQEDAKCRRISSEIFKHRLYETVLCRGPARRRCLSVNIGDEDRDINLYPVRYVQSVPTTPIFSETSSPFNSPRESRRARLGHSKWGGKGSTQSLHHMDQKEEYTGLACILQRDSPTESTDDLGSLGDLEIRSDFDLDIDLHIEEEGDLSSKKHERLSPKPNSPNRISSDDKDDKLFLSPSRIYETGKDASETRKDTKDTSEKDKREISFTKSHQDKLSPHLPGLKKRCKGIVTRDMLDGCLYS